MKSSCTRDAIQNAAANFAQATCETVRRGRKEVARAPNMVFALSPKTNHLAPIRAFCAVTRRSMCLQRRFSRKKFLRTEFRRARMFARAEMRAQMQSKTCDCRKTASPKCCGNPQFIGVSALCENFRGKCCSPKIVIALILAQRLLRARCALPRGGGYTQN
jgi:hypothetical protein